MKNDWLIYAYYCILASFLAFILVPVFMIGGDPEDYRFIDFSIFIKTGLLFSIFLGVFLTLICLVLHLCGLRKVSKYFSYFVFLWIFVTGFLMPVSVSSGMVDPEKISVNWLNFIVSIIVVGGLSFAGLTVEKKYIKAFVVVVLLTSLTPALFSIYASGIWASATKKTHSYLDLSSKKNILVVSFDGMPGYIVTGLIKENEKFSTTLKDFVVFSNAVSQSPATQASQMGELFGVHDFKSKGESTGKVMKSLVAEGLVSRLLANHIPDSYRHGYNYAPAKPIYIVTPEQLAQQKVDTFDFFRYPIARLWTSKLLNFFNWQNSTEALQTYLLHSDESFDLSFRLRNHKGEQWDKPYILQMSLFDEVVERLSIGNKDFSIRYLHFLFTHFPVDFDEYCSYRSDDAEWYEKHQNEEGLKLQTKCAIGLFSDFIQKLKVLGIYDNSLIVFKSDHGEPSDYFSQSPNNLTINGFGRWGYNRYRPALMIKDFGSNNSEPVFREELVLLNDLAKTLCMNSSLTLDCDAFPGVDLLGDSLVSDEPYYLYVVTDADGAHFKFEHHISVTIPSRKMSLLEAMRGSDLIDLKVPKQKSNPYQKKIEQSHVDYKKRLADLKTIKNALFDFYGENKKYPLSDGWSGVYSNWGESSPSYIKGLVPEFLDSLPVDPRESSDGGMNYLYLSDGKDFKFIVHGATAYDMVNVDKSLIDPQRSTKAYGIWSEGAENW